MQLQNFHYPKDLGKVPLGILGAQNELVQGFMAYTHYTVPPVQIPTELISKFNHWQELHRWKPLNLILLPLCHCARARFCNVSTSTNKPSVTGAESCGPAALGNRPAPGSLAFAFFSGNSPSPACAAGWSYLLLEQLPFLWDQLQTVSLELITGHV